MRFDHGWAALAAIVLLQAGLLGWSAYSVGITVDEPAHLVSSVLYWQGRDVLLPRDMPPLIKIAAGSMTEAGELGIDPGKIPAGEWEWDYANRIMLRDNPGWIGPVFARTRLALIVFPVLTTLLVFLWARRNLGPMPAVIAAFLFAFEPTSLAHGSLVKNDHAAASAFFLFCFAAWRYAAVPSAWNLAGLSGSVWLAISAKLSLVICLPMGLAIIAFSLRRWQAIVHAGVLMASLYGAMCAASWFDLAPLTPAEFQSSGIAQRLPQWSTFFEPLFTGMPVPRLYWNGLNALLYWNAEAGHPIYLLGRHVPQGSIWYFLVCILVKVPEGFLLLLAAGLGAVLAAWREGAVARACFLLVPGGLYVAAASLTAMQLGIRLILPALPFAALIAASTFSRPLPPWARRTALAALAAFALATAAGAPHWIGYFNALSGGRENALTYLAGSNVDWGQDLPALRRWMDEAKPPRVKFYYFGNDNPFRFFSDREIEPQAPPWGPDLVKEDRLRPAPGYYVISANLLPGHFFEPRFQDYFAAFRNRRPLALAGASLYVFRVP